MTTSILSQTVPVRWAALARTTDVRCMVVVSLLALGVLVYFIATLHAVVARGPWKPVVAERQSPTTPLVQRR